jgi:predicted metalloprotease with PDZ domain
VSDLDDGDGGTRHPSARTPFFVDHTRMLPLALLAVVSALASAVPPEAPSVRPRTPDVAYRLALATQSDSPPHIDVSVRFPADADGVTTLALEESWGGIDNDGRDVADLVVAGEDGTPLAVERAKPWAWTVAAAAGQTLTARYRITATPPREDKALGNDYRTRLTDSLFQSIGHFSLLMPEHVGGEGRVPRLSIGFDGFDRAGWNVTSSWGPGAGPFERDLAPSEFRHTTLLAATPEAARMHRRTVKGRDVGVAIVGNDWGFRDETFVDLATRIIEVERDFFDDHTDPWFLVTVTPEGGRASQNSFSLGGTGLLDCFSLYCNTGLSLDDGSPFLAQVKFLLAHEYFHTWNGTKMRATDGGEKDGGFGVMWFSEGFTNFYARELLRRAGLIDDATYAEKLNEALAGYDANPFRNAENATIREKFWTDPNVGQLPYQRGDLAAMVIDANIRARSGGTRSLDDVMRALVARAKTDPDVDANVILDALAAEVDAPTAAWLRPVLLDGKDVPMPTAFDRPKLRLVAKRMQTFDPGLDREKSAASGTVSGVRDGGAAHRAGLRNGQALRAFRIGPGADASSPPRATVEIDENGAARVIEYDAVSEPKDVRAYQPA